ncbi:MAG: leucine--tRNA ligase [bacterium]|nr:leucine--tRNA ligase [bacterium]
MQYEPNKIERKWRAIWEERKLHHAVKDETRPKYYCLDMFPYPSGEGLHVGHWRGYVLSDVWSRYMTLLGYNVLHPMGWDAFGLPAENAAIKKGVHPETQTKAAVSNMKRQLTDMGSMYDWEREVNSSTPEYYRWTQWVFLKAYELGLAYKKGAPINWCPGCRCGLADEEVKEGRCDRCGSEVTKKNLNQWFFGISKYAQRLIDDIKPLDWPEKVKKMQIDWIGRSEGAEVCFQLEGLEDKLWIYTTRPDTLFGATYMVMAPEHPLVDKITTDEQREAVEAYRTRTSTRSEVERQEQREKTGVFTGGYAINPVNGKRTPIWISDYVLMGYGTGAIMAVPSHDTRDWDFAKAFDIPIIQVVLTPEQEKELAGCKGAEELNKAYAEKYPQMPLTEAYCEVGTMINSGEFSGLKSDVGRKRIVESLEAKGLGRTKINYRLRDWLVSRQRYWGAPIPMVYCDDCGIVPVPEEQLPVLLPHVDKYEPSGTGESPLAAIDEFVNTTCPKCGKPARRDTDTISQWICSSWYFLRYSSYDCQDQAWRKEDVDYWNPVDMYVGGIEHAVLHLLYSRFCTKMFYDLGLVKFTEPFQRLFNQGMICKVGHSGRLEKMSKSKGNVVNPDELVEKYGTDSLRAYELFIGPPELDAEWNDSGIDGVYRWIKRVWNFAQETEFAKDKESDIEVLRLSHRFIKKINDDLQRLHLNTVVAALMEWMNGLYTLRSQGKTISEETLRQYIVIASPIIPHTAEEMWHNLGEEKSLFEGKPAWPTHKEEYTVENTFKLAVQVNGKVRATLEIPMGTEQAAIEELARANERVAAQLEGKTVRRVIYVPNKLLNIVVG